MSERPLPPRLKLHEFRTAADAAKALAAHLRERFDDEHVTLMTPAESHAWGSGRCWRVIWEGGPFEWGINLSLADDGLDGTLTELGIEYDWTAEREWYLEPYYSFDVCFAIR